MMIECYHLIGPFLLSLHQNYSEMGKQGEHVTYIYMYMYMYIGNNCDRTEGGCIHVIRNTHAHHALHHIHVHVYEHSWSLRITVHVRLITWPHPCPLNSTFLSLPATFLKRDPHIHTYVYMYVYVYTCTCIAPFTASC